MRAPAGEAGCLVSLSSRSRRGRVHTLAGGRAAFEVHAPGIEPIHQLTE